MILNEKAADWTSRAVSPLKNIPRCSSLQRSLQAVRIEFIRWTWKGEKGILISSFGAWQKV